MIYLDSAATTLQKPAAVATASAWAIACRASATMARFFSCSLGGMYWRTELDTDSFDLTNAVARELLGR